MRIATEHGARAVVSEHWLKGGEGALELAEMVIEACSETNDFKFLYEPETPLRERIQRIATQIYGATDVSYSELAEQKLRELDADPASRELGTCMVKTHLSLSHDPQLKGRPRDWVLPVRDILVYRGAGFAVPVAGEIKLMPGTASRPAFTKIDVDVQNGRVTGLF